ncbi:hypothetical protein [Nocardioides sp. MH1]|uniref:hypothetical protein n=1 Tax=Nocardioides sp. MH1 TaxID=3242490 RepID=UPI00351F844E
MSQGPYEPYPQQPPVPGSWGELPGQPVVPSPPGVPAVPTYPAVPVFYGYPPQALQQQSASGMYVAAAVINWVYLGVIILATCGIGLIALAWFIPMTINIHKGARDRRKHTSLGVCTLLFCNIISGILILVEDGNRSS